jgi:CHASE2 domain-containing sensor protein
MIVREKGEITVENTRLSAKAPVFIGLLLIGLGLVLFVLNFSVLPVIGAVLGVPAVGAGIYVTVKGSRNRPESPARSK